MGEEMLYFGLWSRVISKMMAVACKDADGV
jgi:hypothetical protein